MIQTPLSSLYEEMELNQSSLPVRDESTQVLMTVSYTKSVIWPKDFQKLKNYRRVATRYERLARNDLSMIHLIAAVLWLA